MLVKYVFADGNVSEVEVNEEIGNFILQSRKSEHANDEKQRSHCVSLNSACFEGNDYADSNTVETLIESFEMRKSFDLFFNSLTRIQKRRIEMLSSGMSAREIARIEGVNLSKIQKTISQVKKNLKKFENEGGQNGT